MIFPVAGNNWEKKLIIMEKRKKKNLCRKFEVGYCPSVLQVVWVMKKIVLQYNFSIAEKKAVGLYCKMGVLAWNCAAIQFTVL